MNIFNSGIFIGLILAIIDIISMGIVKEVSIKKFNNNWMIFAIILYGIQMIIFRHGLENVSMTTLNLTWNIFSSIVITLVGLYYFHEKISNLEKYGVLFGLISLILFSLSNIKNN